MTGIEGNSVQPKSDAPPPQSTDTEIGSLLNKGVKKGFDLLKDLTTPAEKPTDPLSQDTLQSMVNEEEDASQLMNDVVRSQTDAKKPKKTVEDPFEMQQLQRNYDGNGNIITAPNKDIADLSKNISKNVAPVTFIEQEEVAPVLSDTITNPPQNPPVNTNPPQNPPANDSTRPKDGYCATPCLSPANPETIDRMIEAADTPEKIGQLFYNAHLGGLGIIAILRAMMEQMDAAKQQEFFASNEWRELKSQYMDLTAAQQDNRRAQGKAEATSDFLSAGISMGTFAVQMTSFVGQWNAGSTKQANAWNMFGQAGQSVLQGADNIQKGVTKLQTSGLEAEKIKMDAEAEIANRMMSSIDQYASENGKKIESFLQSTQQTLSKNSEISGKMTSH